MISLTIILKILGYVMIILGFFGIFANTSKFDIPTWGSVFEAATIFGLCAMGLHFAGI